MLSISTMIKLGVQSNVRVTCDTCWQKNGVMDVVVESMSHTVGAESDQQVNICSFAVRCDRR